MIYLSKCDFLGHITVDTPYDAIIDVASAYGVSVDRSKLSEILYLSQVVTTLSRKKPYLLEDIRITQANARYIAMFLNPDQKLSWFKKQLERALKHTLETLLTSNLKGSKVGYPTPGNEDLISPAICAGILIKRGIKLNSRIDIPSLEKLLKFSSGSTDSQRDILFSHFYSLNPLDVAHILCLKRELVKLDPLKIENYLESSSILATNANSIVAFAFKKYRIDISSAENPFIELQALENDCFPSSHDMRIIKKLNPKAFNADCYFNLTLAFKSYDNDKGNVFDESLSYTKEDLTLLAKKNGIMFSKTSPNYKSIYNMLKAKCMTKSFYKGIVPSIRCFETPIDLIDVDKLTSTIPLVSYGANNDYRVFTVQELTNTFNNYSEFKFGEEEPITLGAIQDLSRIAISVISIKSTTIANKAIWIQLSASIGDIEAIYKDTQLYANRFLNFYNDSSSKSEIVKILTCIFELSLYMRGWDGVSKWPINEDDIPKFSDKLYDTKKREADIRASDHISKLRKMTKGKVGKAVIAMPLIRMFNGNYQISTEFHQGSTIEERLFIVEKDIIDNACIGMSSNWFLSSSFFYLDAIDKKPKFNIQNISIVSESVRRIDGRRFG